MGRHADEWVDLVDDGDRVLGTVTRAEVRAEKLLHRGVSIAVRNSLGEIYVHRRTLAKDIHPGAYDMFVAGMVASGESYEDAARRELAEELGIEVAAPRRLFKHLFRDDDNPHWDAVFELLWDGAIRPQIEEIAWGAFMPADELESQRGVWEFSDQSWQAWDRYRAL
jgi:8-oxo-dGTP pyrophosphatase MutT (NUDIX family)